MVILLIPQMAKSQNYQGYYDRETAIVAPRLMETRVLEGLLKITKIMSGRVIREPEIALLVMSSKRTFWSFQQSHKCSGGKSTCFGHFVNLAEVK